MTEEKTYAISVYYVDYPMGRSPEYSVSGGHTLEEAERIVEEKLCEVDKDPEKFACANPVFTIKEQEPREEDEEESLVKTKLVLHLDVGKFPSDRNSPEDYIEYLNQSIRSYNTGM